MAQSSSDKSLISNRYEAEQVGAGVEGPIFVWIGGEEVAPNRRLPARTACVS